MKLGFLTAPFPETPLMEVADWAAQAEFEVLEIACWPMSGGVKRKYAGTAHIDVANLTDAQAGEIKSEIAEKGLDISGLGFYPNPVSYTHLTLPTNVQQCRSRWSPCH